MGLSVAPLCQQEDKPGRVGGEPVPSKAEKVGSGQTSSGKPSEKVGKTWLDLTCLAMLCCAVVNGPLNYVLHGCFHTSASHNCKATAVVIHLSLTASVQSNLNDTSQHSLAISQTLFEWGLLNLLDNKCLKMLAHVGAMNGRISRPTLRESKHQESAQPQIFT